MRLNHFLKRLTFTPPEYAPTGQFWLIYALIGGVRVNSSSELYDENVFLALFLLSQLWIQITVSTTANIKFIDTRLFA